MANSLYKELRNLLIVNGCTFVRQGKGSHEIWQSPITMVRFPVPFNVESVKTANGILRQAGIKERL